MGISGSLTQMRKLSPRREEGTCPDCPAPELGCGADLTAVSESLVIKNTRLEGDVPGLRSHGRPQAKTELFCLCQHSEGP